MKAVRLRTGVIADQGTGMEIDLALLGAFAAVAPLGARAFSVDALLDRVGRAPRCPPCPCVGSIAA